MKNTLKTFVLLFVTAIIVSSCHNKSGLAVMKRHYRPGYFVESGNKRSTQLVVKEKKVLGPVPKAAPVAGKTPEVIVDVNVNVEELEDHSMLHAEQKTEERIKTRISFKPEKKNVSSYPADRCVQGSIERATFSEDIVSGADRTSEALSFLWLICLILLALWLIAFLTGGWGLGGLIHIILVVALILFVLWLLRII